MKTLRESDLREVGLMIDPTNPSRAVPIKSREDATPDETWEIERLTDYAVRGLEQAQEMEAEASLVGRRSTVWLFRVGHALSIIRGKLKDDGAWCNWQKEYHIPRTNAWEAIQLYLRGKSEEAVSTLSPTEAREKFGISTRRSRAESQTRASRQRRRSHARSAEDTSDEAATIGQDDVESVLYKLHEIDARLAEVKKKLPRIQRTPNDLTDLRVAAAEIIWHGLLIHKALIPRRQVIAEASVESTSIVPSVRPKPVLPLSCELIELPADMKGKQS